MGAFGWHPAFMSIGFAGLMTEGLLAYLAVPARSHPQTRSVQRSLHVGLQCGALACMVAGFYW